MKNHRRLGSVFCSALCFATMMVLLGVLPYHSSCSVVAFELKHVGRLSNTTKNRLMMPLRLDTAVIPSRRALAATTSDQEGQSPPRGIFLNTAVGGLTFAGGLMGFITKGSKASLIAGSTFGGLLMLSAFLIAKSSETKSSKGNALGSSVAGMLGYVMGKKFLASRKFMPAGLLAGLSAVAFVYNLIEIKVLSKSSSSSGSSDPEGAKDE